MKSETNHQKEPSDEAIRKIATILGCKTESAKILLQEYQPLDAEDYLSLLEKSEVFKNSQVRKLLFFDAEFAAEFVQKNSIGTQETRDQILDESRAKLRGLLGGD